MSKVIIQIVTDHADYDEAARSVMNGLKRAGYVIEDYVVQGDDYTEADVLRRTIDSVEHADPVLIYAQEPEVAGV